VTTLAAETTNAYAVAAIGVIGSLVGGVIVAVVSLVLARQARTENRRQWVRDERREAFARYLSAGQATLDACQKRGPLSNATDNVDTSSLSGTYAVVQIVADEDVVAAARTLMYRLLVLAGFRVGAHGTEDEFFEISKLVRRARHATIDAMRKELEQSPFPAPEETFDAFRGTDFEGRFVAS